MSTPAFRRIVRRETHSPRSVAMIIAVVLLILALVYVAVEIVLALLAQPALLLGPAAALTWIVGLPSAQPSGFIILAGVIIAILGIVFFVLGITPGRLPKHQMSGDDRAVVVDNGVIAASLAQRISDETGIKRDDITVGVAHRAVDVTVRTSFQDLQDPAPITRVVNSELESYALIPSVKPRVRVVAPSEKED